MKIELSEAECEEIVRKATENENVENVKFNVENFGNYLGFLGEYFRLKINADVNGQKKELKFFMKSLPITDLKQRQMLIETGIFQKEVKLYENLLPKLSQLSLSTNEMAWCPTVYCHRDDILVLEDLSLKGYKILPREQEFNQNHVEAVLKSLARFHCSSIVYEAELGGEEPIRQTYEKTLFETSVDDITWFHAGLKVTVVFIIL